MITIAVANPKGGVGKTTLTANLDALLADLGIRVLMVDADVQPTLSSKPSVPVQRLAKSSESCFSGGQQVSISDSQHGCCCGYARRNPCTGSGIGQIGWRLVARVLVYPRLVRRLASCSGKLLPEFTWIYSISMTDAQIGANFRAKNEYEELYESIRKYR